MLIKKKWILTSIECVFLDFWDARGLGLLFVVCACAVGLRGNRLTGMRGTWGVVWRSAHVPTIPFTWLRRANALDPTTHASNYQALLSTKLCEKCRFNSCVRVFLIPWGHVDNHDQIWAFVTSMGSPDLNARFWLVETNFAALWLVNTYWSPFDYCYNVVTWTRQLLFTSTSTIFSITEWQLIFGKSLGNNFRNTVRHHRATPAKSFKQDTQIGYIKLNWTFW